MTDHESPVRATSGPTLTWWVPLTVSPLTTVPAAAAAWWLVGDLSFRAPPSVPLDYLVEAPSVAPGLVSGVGIAALVAGAMLLAAVTAAVCTQRLSSGWIVLVIVLAGCGAVAGWAARVVTAGVIGVNIGGGLVIVVVGPLLGVVLLLALARALILTRRDAALNDG